jgi:hypothetical protein
MTTTTSQMTELLALIGELPSVDERIERLEFLLTADADAVGTMTWALKMQLHPSADVIPSAPYVPPAGTYLVNGAHFTIKVSKSSKVAYVVSQNGFYQGALTHPKNASLYAELDTATKAHAAVVAYAKVTGKCGVCHTKLTDPKSIAAGIGPVCAKKYGM